MKNKIVLSVSSEYVPLEYTDFAFQYSLLVESLGCATSNKSHVHTLLCACKHARTC